MALYLMCVYGDPDERVGSSRPYKQAGKKLDMGKSCVRFKSLDALPLDVIGEAISHVSVDKYVASYHAIRAGMTSTTAVSKPRRESITSPPTCAKPSERPRGRREEPPLATRPSREPSSGDEPTSPATAARPREVERSRRRVETASVVRHARPR